MRHENAFIQCWRVVPTRLTGNTTIEYGVLNSSAILHFIPQNKYYIHGSGSWNITSWVRRFAQEIVRSMKLSTPDVQDEK